uniref:FAD-dependent oxidoreductase domain-containing protein 1 n=1 Tax=Chenopodium quinoa TaxID=63459 RepID=A0A803MFR2_CHEQI
MKQKMAGISILHLNPNPSLKFKHQIHTSLNQKNQLFSILPSPRKINSRNGGNLGIGAVCATHTFDVVVVGAGIIGLSIARDLLLRSNLSVAVVDAAVPCSGATGAGSLLIGRTETELNQLKRRVQELSKAGIRAEYLSHNDLANREPELGINQQSGAAFLPDDCQLDAYRTMAFIEKGNRLFKSLGRYAEFYHDPAVRFIRSNGKGKIDGIITQKNTLYGRKATIIAAGCWTGSLMDKLLQDSHIVLHVPIKPRKGFLLNLENFDNLDIRHGLMEAGYVDHQKSVISESEGVDHNKALSVSMTVTRDACGNLLIGSSRQFAGFNTELEMFIVDRIWERTQQFFPALKEFSVKNLSEQMNVRIGLRPYMPDGKPVIGPVPGIPNLFLASGHEGGGLSMALGTAEMVTDLVLDNPLQLDCKPFSVEGRCC